MATESNVHEIILTPRDGRYCVESELCGNTFSLVAKLVGPKDGRLLMQYYDPNKQDAKYAGVEFLSNTIVSDHNWGDKDHIELWSTETSKAKSMLTQVATNLQIPAVFIRKASSPAILKHEGNQHAMASYKPSTAYGEERYLGLNKDQSNNPPNAIINADDVVMSGASLRGVDDVANNIGATVLGRYCVLREVTASFEDIQNNNGRLIVTARLPNNQSANNNHQVVVGSAIILTDLTAAPKDAIQYLERLLIVPSRQTTERR